MDQPAKSTIPIANSGVALSAKKRVEKEVLETIMDGLGGGEIDSQKAQDIARETLATLKMLDEHEESIEKFYQNLAAKYPIFNLLYTKIKDERFRSREVSAHQQALSAIDEGNIDEARKIATGAILQTANEATDAK